jgi:circadian clock protein KaiC
MYVNNTLTLVVASRFRTVEPSQATKREAAAAISQAYRSQKDSHRVFSSLLEFSSRLLDLSDEVLAMEDSATSDRVSTGVEGLDTILGGGLPRNRIYLLEGRTGTGKTTLALQFLLDGARRGERGLYITLSETKEELLAVARSHGWSLDDINIYDLAVPEKEVLPDSQYTLYHPSEVELGETTKAIFHQFELVRPARVVLDSMSEIRLQAREALRYRRQILALKQFFVGKQSTVLLLDDQTSDSSTGLLEGVVHGVVVLQQLAHGYGPSRRNLHVLKLREVKYRSGFHDINIETGGIIVYPRLADAEHRSDFNRDPLLSRVAELDALIGGGLDAGTATLIMGPAGSGKSTLAAQFAASAGAQDKTVAFFIFDENPNTLLIRTRAIGIDLESLVKTGRVIIRQVDPGECSAGEFSYLVRQTVERDKASVVVIDSVNAYFESMPEEKFLTAHVHELLSYLSHQGVSTLLVLAQYGIVGTTMPVPVDLSYLADTVLLLRFFESAGDVRQALSVVKKRTGDHERTIREFRITSQGIQVGPPLRRFQGVLTGVPQYIGNASPLLQNDDSSKK